jgi:hypothetical protein
MSLATLAHDIAKKIPLISRAFARKIAMINLKYKKCWVSVNGDYYQIMFDDDYPEPNNYDDNDEVMNSIGPYFLIQFSYEFPGKECNIESDKEELSGHYIVNSVVIRQQTFTINYGPDDRYIVNIEFDEIDEEQDDLIKASKDMFLNVLDVQVGE